VDNFKVLHTSVLPPLITGIEALSVDSRSAQLVALVNPRGQPTSATISYRDPSGKETTVATRFLGSGRDDVLLQFPVDSLTPNSQYVLGISATNTSGTNSTNASFTTHAADYSGPLARGDSFHTLSATAPFTVPVSVNDANPDQVATVRLPRQGEVGYNPYVTTDGRTVTFNPPAPKWEGIYYGWTYQFDGNGFFSYFLIVDGVDVSKALVSL
jgi:hypothetical protein